MWTRQLVICLGLLGAVSAAGESAAQTPLHLWSQRFGGTSLDKAHSVAVDGSGNVLVTGVFRGTVNLGGGNLGSPGGEYIFVAKYDASGVHQWSRGFGGGASGGFLTGGVAVDGSGNVLLTGYFIGTTDFGGGDLVSAGSADIFVAKYDASGVHQWSRRFGSFVDDIGEAIAVDGSGNVVLTGVFGGTVSFGGANLVSVGGTTDIFVAKYNSAGVHQWSQRFGTSGAAEGANSIVVDGAGNVLLTGFFSGTVNFGGANLVSVGGDDIFLAKYNSGGVHQWSQNYGSSSHDLGESLAVDGSGNVLLTGACQAGALFGGDPLFSAGFQDIFLAKFNANGAHQWSKRFGGQDFDLGYGVAADASGNVLLTGYFRFTVNFGGGDLVSSIGLATFLAKFTPAGVHQWSQRFGGTTGGYVGDTGGMAVDGSDNVLLTGWFHNTVNFGGGDFVSAGSSDIFVAKFRPNVDPLIASVVDVETDQGRSVALRYTRSAHDDSGAPTPVEQYEAFLRDDALPSATLAAPASTKAISDLSLLTPGWIFVGSVPAHREDEYLMIAPTLTDSTITSGQHHSVFFLRAATSDPGIYFDSLPDSGYSVDNLAPGVPTDLAYSANNLTWDESVAADFDHFTVYGSNTSSFASATLIQYTVNPVLNVSGSPYSYYFVTATDFAGNEGIPAVLDQTTDVGGPPQHFVLSVSAHPNPFNPATTIRYTLPASGHVKIAMHDARGTRVATLLDEEQPAGAYMVPWNGKNDAGEIVTSGVYFAKIAFGDERRSYKTVLLK